MRTFLYLPQIKEIVCLRRAAEIERKLVGWEMQIMFRYEQTKQKTNLHLCVCELDNTRATKN